MAPKKRASSTKKSGSEAKRAKKTNAKEKEKTNTGVPDHTQFEMESIRRARPYNKAIEYEIKWKHYPPSDNSYEQDIRVSGRLILLEHAGDLLKDDYSMKIDDWMEDLHRMSEKDFVSKLNPLTIIAENCLFGGNTLFMNDDSIGSKRQFLEALKKHEQLYTVQTIVLASLNRSEGDMKRWREEYTIRAQCFPSFPFFQLTYPTYREWGTVTYPPPPLSSLVFDTFTVEEIESNPHAVAPASEDVGFNTVCPFIDKTYLESINRPENDPAFAQIHVKSEDPKANPFFAVNLHVHYDPKDIKWVVYPAVNVNGNTPLVKMCGVLRDREEAHTAFVEEGERMAFSSFIAIPGTDKVIDRRQYYDLSKYIGHSCTPTCEVRLVKNPTSNIPDVVVFSRFELKGMHDKLTIDYFKGFRREIDNFFNSKNDGKDYENYNERMFYCYDNDRDFVFCSCEADVYCRKVLYMDQSTKKHLRETPKVEKLRNMPEDFKFYGMNLIA